MLFDFAHRALVVCLLFGIASCCCAIETQNVLVLYNGEDADSTQIAEYYAQARPGVHLAPLSGISAVMTGPYNEEITGQDYLDVLRPQVLSAIDAAGDDIDVIVTTKGLPLRIDAQSGPVTKRYSSLESELTRVDTIDSLSDMLNQTILVGWEIADNNMASNPFFKYQRNEDVYAPYPGFDDFGKFTGMRLTSRLDGYSVDSVLGAINRAQNVFVLPTTQRIVLDDTPGADPPDRMIDRPSDTGYGPGTRELITSIYPDPLDGTDPVPLLYDDANEAVLSSDRPVIGYVSHGVHGGLSGDYMGGFVDSQFRRGDLEFDLADGAVFQTHESYNAQSFDPANTQTQGLIADWLEIGGTAGLGHVSEGENGWTNVANEDLFYQMLLPRCGASAVPGESGLTFAEAAWGATRQLSYVNTIVGDPLMTFRAWLPGDTNLDGKVEFLDFFTLQWNWGGEGTFQEGDFNGDGLVNEADLAILQENWLTDLTTPLAASQTSLSVDVQPVLDSGSNSPELMGTLLTPANLDGDLDVDEDDRAILMASFGLDDGGDIDGDGDTDLADLMEWQRQYAPYTLQADFNLDLKVDGEDSSLWRATFGVNRGGDADNDGDTDIADLLALQRELSGLSADDGLAVQRVPEPAAVGLLLGAGVLLIACRRSF